MRKIIESMLCVGKGVNIRVVNKWNPWYELGVGLVWYDCTYSVYLENKKRSIIEVSNI